MNTKTNTKTTLLYKKPRKTEFIDSMKDVLQTLPVDHNLFMEYYNGFYQNYPDYNLIDSVSWRWPESDYLELIRYLHKKLGETCTTEAMDWASYRGHLNTVKYLYEECDAKCTEQAMDWAFQNSNIEVLKYLHEKVKAKYTQNYFVSRDFTNLELLKFVAEDLGEKQFKKHTLHGTLKRSCVKGDVELLKYLHENLKVNFRLQELEWASENGQLEIVKYLHEVGGLQYTEDVMNLAKWNGHEMVVQYLVNL